MLDKNTTRGKTVRTAVQTLLGVGLLFLVSPQFQGFIQAHPAYIAYVPLVVALFTAAQNYFDKNVPN